MHVMTALPVLCVLFLRFPNAHQLQSVELRMCGWVAADAAACGPDSDSDKTGWLKMQIDAGVGPRQKATRSW